MSPFVEVTSQRDAVDFCGFLPVSSSYRGGSLFEKHLF